MDRNMAIARLRAHAEELRRLGVEHLCLFGSTVRDAAESDVDLFFDHGPAGTSLFRVLEIGETAGRILVRKADVMNRDSLHPVLRGEIEASAYQVF